MNTDICRLFPTKRNLTAWLSVTIFPLNCLGNNTADYTRVLQNENKARKKIFNYTKRNSKKSRWMNYANQLCQCFISLKVQVQLALHCVIREASSMGYGCRELSNQKRVWVMWQSQAVRGYPVGDTMPLRLLEIGVTLSCFQSTDTARASDILWWDIFFSWAGQK